MHPSHRDPLRRSAIVVGLLALILLLSWVLPPPSAARGIAGYVPLHTLFETAAIVIAMLVFAVGWNAYSRVRPGNIVLLACAFLGVGLLDFSHALSFPGMPDFVTPSSPEKAINFWLAARVLAAVALLAVALVPWRAFASRATRFVLLGAVLAGVGFAHWVFLYQAEAVPRTFIAGQGLTAFKLYVEYAIIAANLVAACVLLVMMRKPQPFEAAALFGAVCAMAMSEFFFTLYSSLTDIFNLMGHVYKAVSYLFLYRAIFVGTIEEPYRQLHAALGQINQFNAQLERGIAERTAQLETATQAADSANCAKSTFLATMSHEIRTPMNGVLGMVELLSLTKLEAEQRTTVEIVRESAKSLLRIIDDILDFSKIEAGKLDVRPEPTSIKALIEGVHNIYSGNASSIGLLIKRSVDPGISPALLVDPLRLRQILNNFVSNALKFTSHGHIEVKAELVDRIDGEDRVRFSVADTGIGISAENQQHLFQPFSQAEAGTTRRFGGTGLGLSICRRLAEMMGGSIAMVSELGKGTTMVLTLSLPHADPGDLVRADSPAGRQSGGRASLMRRAPPSIPEAVLEGTLVLVVDDHPINRLVLLRQVGVLGYAAESADNGVEALEKWKTGRFAVIITDCNMPEMDGYDLARNIRALEAGKGHERIRLLACTANALGGEAEVCFAAGMDDYLAKPVELTQMMEKLDRWLPLSKVVIAPAQDFGQAPREPASKLAAPFDRSVLAELCGDDGAAERDILIEVRRANEQDAALLRAALADRDFGNVTRAMHRMRGASMMVGAVELATLCERIECAGRANDWTAVESNLEAFQKEWRRMHTYLEALENESPAEPEAAGTRV
ncbi:MAG: MASE3 domain-containing protein [Casimicrobiaceae bacterium]